MVSRKKRTEQVGIYFSEDEKKKIVDEAAKYDLSVSDYCRRVINGVLPALEPKKE